MFLFNSSLAYAFLILIKIELIIYACIMYFSNSNHLLLCFSKYNHTCIYVYYVLKFSLTYLDIRTYILCIFMYNKCMLYGISS